VEVAFKFVCRRLFEDAPVAHEEKP
jgi:hypothetical protein